jgi:hypothetical protein
MKMTKIAEALTALRPAIAERYAAQVRRSFERMVKDYGPSLKGIYNSWEHARNYSNLVSQYLVNETPNSMNGILTLDEKRLSFGANLYAEAATLEWEAKINAKLGDLENVQIKQFQGASFLISGHRKNHAVAIDQDMILKSSSRGTLFNQFPARIYVDGKFTSEKKYHAMFA